MRYLKRQIARFPALFRLAFVVLTVLPDAIQEIAIWRQLVVQWLVHKSIDRNLLEIIRLEGVQFLGIVSMFCAVECQCQAETQQFSAHTSSIFGNLHMDRGGRDEPQENVGNRFMDLFP